jgi:hypothetical protein
MPPPDPELMAWMLFGRRKVLVAGVAFILGTMNMWFLFGQSFLYILESMARGDDLYFYNTFFFIFLAPIMVDIAGVLALIAWARTSPRSTKGVMGLVRASLVIATLSLSIMIFMAGIRMGESAVFLVIYFAFFFGLTLAGIYQLAMTIYVCRVSTGYYPPMPRNPPLRGGTRPP